MNTPPTPPEQNSKIRLEMIELKGEGSETENI